MNSRYDASRGDWGNGARRASWLTAALASMLVAACAAVLIWRPQSATDSPEFHTVTRGDLAVRCRFESSLEAVRSIDLYCELTALMLADGERQAAELLWIVDHGTLVQEGDLLAEFDATLVRDELDRWQLQLIKSEGLLKQNQLRYENQKLQRIADLTSATERLQLIVQSRDTVPEPQRIEAQELVKTIGQALSGADADLLQSRAALVRQRLALPEAMTLREARLKEQTANQDFAAAVDLFVAVAQDVAAGQVESLSVAATQAYNALSQSQRDHESTLAQLRADNAATAQALDRQRERAGYFQQQLANCKILAPCAGLVQHVSVSGEGQAWAPGTRIRERQKILTLSDLGEMQLTATLYLPTARYLQVGHAASIVFLSGSRTTYPGTVTRVQHAGTHTSVTVVPTPPCNLAPGTAAVVEIIPQQLSHVLRLPVTAIVTWNDESYCYVPSGSALQQRALQLGVVTEEYAEVLQGIDEGDQVVLDASAVERGM